MQENNRDNTPFPLKFPEPSDQQRSVFFSANTDVDCTSESEYEIRITPDPVLLTKIDEAASLMNITRSELVMKILRLWEKKQNLPLNGTDHLCNLIPDTLEEGEQGVQQ